MSEFVLSATTRQADWSEVRQLAERFGVKGANALAIPRPWTLPFALISADTVAAMGASAPLSLLLGSDRLGQLRDLAGAAGSLIVRSSVVGETIWDRGTYTSLPFTVSEDLDLVAAQLDQVAKEVVASTDRPTGLMVQLHLQPAALGEFGNLQRISKTRDQWEISTLEAGGMISRLRLNSQRDQAAEPTRPLLARVGLPRERLFGAIGAWLNNELMLGYSRRMNCEWITDNRRFFIVQLDEEEEDTIGINPFQVRIPPVVKPLADSGYYLKLADGAARTSWDKLQVLDELWEPEATHKPRLFYVPLIDLPSRATKQALARLEGDFRDLIGPAGIVVRTSVAAGAEKLLNLPRTECLSPEAAAEWCFAEARKLAREHQRCEIAFVAHRFVAARASVWAKAEPADPMVEINALWGLPDALQYCPYDIWEVHVPTGVATEYPDYKSDILIPQDDGGWKYVRVKNELARNNSIGSREAKEIAARSAAIAERLGKACHIMWFVGCVEEGGLTFNIPWYWTEAHVAERNPDRSTYREVPVGDREELRAFVSWKGARNRQALALKPKDVSLMRDMDFIKSVGLAAKEAEVPIILSGSTLAHAYYQLRKLGCTVVTPSEKEHSRVRQATSLGKLVRDKIPDKIARRHEVEITRQVPGDLMKGFLLSKLVEEALEVREATEPHQKTEELADLFEVFRALAVAEGVALEEIADVADRKKEKAGGFERGLILMQTSISRSDRRAGLDGDRGLGEVLSQRISDDRAEVPFSFFGFMEMDQPRSIYFETLGVRVDLTLRGDRIEIHLARGPEQLGLPLDAEA
ncbi:hypothetical protein ACBY01_14395 [Sphingomonas sp. ac-8]|uniref:hypothetical protein n=1 Tax=Sphingomonas sp. ac-8 TaxID=3242977 RepID=UPI003A7FBF5C